ncbi:MAG: CheR family methyltransferase [Bryobacteraceae bacterium]
MDSELQNVPGQPQSEAIPDATPNHASLTEDVIETPAGTESKSSLLPFPVVGIGASAGGVEAYVELVAALAPDTGMAFVLVPHLSADHESHLVEILARHTKMPVLEIRPDLRPEINQIHIIPKNTRLSLSRGRLHLNARLAGDRLPIDHFFRSLGGHQKNRAIGVVLSGMDSDGALGLKAIKGEGGITIAQSPDSAKFGEMPRQGIAADHVDLILPPAQIGAELNRLGRQFAHPDLLLPQESIVPPTEEPHFNRILTLLRGVSGIDFQNYKPSTLRRRIARRMLLKRSANIADYVQLLQTRPQELRDLQEDILISVTHFFRDPEVFEALKEKLFPRLFEGRVPEQPVRVWVAGCATGEEVYSLAICLIEFFSAQSIEPPIQIFGTDASQLSVEKARLGIYPESITAEVSPERLRRFFVKFDHSYQISKRVRDLCIFARQNLCIHPPFSKLDLVSCRNVLIYLGAKVQKRVILTLNYALRPGGYLLLGSSETIRQHEDLFTLSDRKHKFYSKVGTTTSLPDVMLPILGDSGTPAEGPRPGGYGPWTEADLQRAADRIVLTRHAPVGVVINDRMEVLQVRGHTAPFLEHAPGTPSLSLLRMVRSEFTLTLRDAVQRAIAEDIPVIAQCEARDGDAQHGLTIEVLPIHTTPPKTRSYLILFLPQPAAPSELQPGMADVFRESRSPEETVEISRVREDLSSTRLYLQSLIEERDVRNQELTSAYEEIQSSNEELQSANEELETAKEELQSTNEELQTLNDELQTGNLALLDATNDLSNLLTSVNIPVLMLDGELCIRRFTPTAERLMHIRPSDVGRRIAEIRLNLTIEHIEPVLQEVLDTLGTKEIEVQDQEGHWYLMRARPYRTAENKIDGLVLVLVDIDQIRRGEEAIREARDLAQSVIESVQVSIVVLDGELRVRMANAAFRALSGMPHAEIERRSFPDLIALLWGMEPVRPLLESLRSTGSAFEAEHETGVDGARTYCITGRVVQLEGSRALLITVDDTTLHKQAELLLRHESERLATQVKTTAEQLQRTEEDLRALTASLFTSHDEERRRVARELHDDVSQQLAMLANDLEQLRQNIPPTEAEMRDRLETLREGAATLSEELRRISHALHPSILEDLGLPVALRSLVTEFAEREGMPSNFTHRNVPDVLSHEVSATLYRITQEALRNVAKHAGRTHVRVTLIGKGSALRLTIRDLGEGFDPSETRGLGLISMEERTRLVGGTFRISSALGEGTTVQVQVPLETEAAAIA